MTQSTIAREQLRREHAEWSDATFGDVGPVGPLKHLSKEALETAADPSDPLEWADMQFLLWDAQRRMGISDEFITRAMVEKLAINKARQWPEPKDGEPRLHIKEQPEPVVRQIMRELVPLLDEDQFARIENIALSAGVMPPQPAPVVPEGLNPETADLVLRFASALADKLYKAEQKYGRSTDWMKNDWYSDCLQSLWEHIEKGDPRDVAAYCAFMWHHGWVTTDYDRNVQNACRAAMLQAGSTVRDLSTPVGPQVAEYEESMLQACKFAETQFKPVADLYALCWKPGDVVTYTPEPEKAAIWLNNYSGTCVQEYVKLERLQESASQQNGRSYGKR